MEDADSYKLFYVLVIEWKNEIGWHNSLPLGNCTIFYTVIDFSSFSQKIKAPFNMYWLQKVEISQDRKINSVLPFEFNYKGISSITYFDWPNGSATEFSISVLFGKFITRFMSFFMLIGKILVYYRTVLTSAYFGYLVLPHQSCRAVCRNVWSMIIQAWEHLMLRGPGVPDGTCTGWAWFSSQVRLISAILAQKKSCCYFIFVIIEIYFTFFI